MMYAKTTPPYRKTTISLSATAILSWVAYFAGLIWAEETEAAHTPLYGAFAYVALAASFGAFGFFALGRAEDRRNTTQADLHIPPPVIATEVDSAPTVQIPPPTTPVARRLPQPRVSAGHVYRCDPEMPQPVTVEMRPAGYVEMIPVKYAQMMAQEMEQRGLAAGRQRATVEVVAATRASDGSATLSGEDDRTFLAALGHVADDVLSANDSAAVDPSARQAIERIMRRLRPEGA